MATRLGIYNQALAELGGRELTSLSDVQESRRVLDRLWDAGLVNYCLARGVWNFAIRAVQSTDDPPAPAFGYQYRHGKPTDWVKTSKISVYETFKPLLNDYSDEGSYWYLNYDNVFIQYISNHPSYGGNMARWPESFTYYVALRLACLAAPRLLSRAEANTLLRGSDGLRQLAKHALETAKSEDAQNQPPEFPPMGTWARSRSTDFLSHHDKDD